MSMSEVNYRVFDDIYYSNLPLSSNDIINSECESKNIASLVGKYGINSKSAVNDEVSEEFEVSTDEIFFGNNFTIEFKCDSVKIKRKNSDLEYDKDIEHSINLLSEALRNVRKGNDLNFHAIEKARDILGKVLQQNLDQQTASSSTNSVEKPTTLISSAKSPDKQQTAALTLPTIAPIKWADRKIFVVDEIKDDYIRQKLQAHPELVQQIRDSSDGVTFFNLVWKDYVEAGVMYQSDLRGQQITKKNQHPKEPLDNSLFQIIAKQCRDSQGELDINTILPNNSKKIDRELEEANFYNYQRLASLSATAYRRTQR